MDTPDPTALTVDERALLLRVLERAHDVALVYFLAAPADTDDERDAEQALEETAEALRIMLAARPAPAPIPGPEWTERQRIAYERQRQHPRD